MPLHLPDRFPTLPLNLPPRIAFAAGAGICVVGVLLLGYSLHSQPAQTAVSVAVPQSEAAAQPVAPAPARMVSPPPRDETSCENQTWPYIEQRCLKPTPPHKRAESRPPSTTDGVASASDRATPAVTPAAPMSSPLPDRPMAVTGEPAMLPQGALAKADSVQEPAVTASTGAKPSVKRSTAKRAR